MRRPMPEEELLACQLWVFMDRFIAEMAQDNRDGAFSAHIARARSLQPVVLALSRTAFAHSEEFRRNYEHALRERPKGGGN